MDALFTVVLMGSRKRKRHLWPSCIFEVVSDDQDAQQLPRVTLGDVVMDYKQMHSNGELKAATGGSAPLAQTWTASWKA